MFDAAGTIWRKMNRMNQIKQTPKTRKDKPILPFVAILVLNVLVVGLFLFEDQLSPIPIDSGNMIASLVILLVTVVLVRALYSFTERRPSLYTVSSLVALFEICFVLTQYCYIVKYKKFGLHSPEGITHDKWDALYFSIITWTTTGYGDLVPIGASRWVACSEVLLGTLYNGLALGSVIYQLNLMAKTRTLKPLTPKE
jgi:Ion channel